MTPKRLINDALRTVGVELRRVSSAPQIDTYELDLHKLCFPAEALENRRLYNIGAGRFAHPYWTNVDFLSDWYSANSAKTRTGIHYDLLSLEPIPIESGTAEIVYTSHTIEHINDAAAANLFAETFRVLRKGGVFRATTPNIELDVRAYRSNDMSYWYWAEDYSKPNEMQRVGIRTPMNQATAAQLFLFQFATSVSTLPIDGEPKRVSDSELAELMSTRPLQEALNECTARCTVGLQRKFPGRHLNWWDYEKMERMLKEAGFSNIYRSGYGQSISPVLRNTALFDSTHPKISLYVEAVK